MATEFNAYRKDAPQNVLHTNFSADCQPIEYRPANEHSLCPKRKSLQDIGSRSDAAVE